MHNPLTHKQGFHTDLARGRRGGGIEIVHFHPDNQLYVVGQLIRNDLVTKWKRNQRVGRPGLVFFRPRLVFISLKIETETVIISLQID